MKQIQLINGDITKIKADIIVNAANTSLLGGGGVDGAIHRKGGKEILNDCRKIRNKQGGCDVGKAVITTAGKLDAKFVVHTVGPVWQPNNKKVNKLLSDAYFNSLILAEETKAQSIAFPNISTGIYKFPKKIAAEIAIKTVRDFTTTHNSNILIIFVCYDSENYEIYKNLLDDIHP